MCFKAWKSRAPAPPTSLGASSAHPAWPVVTAPHILSSWILSLNGFLHSQQIRGSSLQIYSLFNISLNIFFLGNFLAQHLSLTIPDLIVLLDNFLVLLSKFLANIVSCQLLGSSSFLATSGTSFLAIFLFLLQRILFVLGAISL